MKLARVRIKDWEEMKEMEEVEQSEVMAEGLAYKDNTYYFSEKMKPLTGLEFTTLINQEGCFEISGFTIARWMYEIIWQEKYCKDNSKVHLERKLAEAEQDLEELDRQIAIKNDYIDVITEFIKWEV